MTTSPPARLARISPAQIEKELANKRKARAKVDDGAITAKYLDKEIGEWSAELERRNGGGGGGRD